MASNAPSDDNGEMTWLASVIGSRRAAASFCRLCETVKEYGHGTVCVEFRGEVPSRIYMDDTGEKLRD